MNTAKIQPRSWYLLLAVGIVTLILGVLALWDVAGRAPVVPKVTVTSSPTTASLPSTENHKADEKRRTVQVDEEIGRELAATSTTRVRIPTSTPGFSTASYTPEPTPTLEMGFFEMGCGGPRNSRDEVPLDCWRGLINGEIVTLRAGRASTKYTQRNYAPQGVFRVNRRFYPIPLDVGPIRISSVEGTRVTLVPADEQAPNLQFLFDFDRRVWLWTPPGAEGTPLAREWVECPFSETLPRQYFYSCWRGKVNDQDIGLDAGRETNISGFDEKGSSGPYETECCKGILRVNYYDPNGEVLRSDTYPTPLILGLVRIASVEGSRVVLATYGARSPDNNFVFDLASTRWLVPHAPAPIISRFGAVTCYEAYEYGWQYAFQSCWRGLVSNRIMSIASGIGLVAGQYSDNSQGMIMVVNGPDLHRYANAASIYQAPEKVGKLHITLVDGTLVYLVSEDGKSTFVFDLEMRQWVSPPVTPTPSATQTPRYFTPTPTARTTEEAIAQQRAVGQTAVANDPLKVPLVPRTPKPSSVWHLERVQCGERWRSGREHQDNAAILDCWSGFGNGTTMSVRSVEAGYTKDPSQGLILVFQGIYFPGGGEHITPLKVGTVRIVSIDGSVVKLASENGQNIFMFDLATSQWLPPGVVASDALLPGSVWCPPGIGLISDYYFSCWKGTVNGETVLLNAGRDNAASYGDPTHNEILFDECCIGVLTVRGLSADKTTYTNETYKTADKVGALYIVSVKGTFVTLASYDPRFEGQLYTFDLATRQWVNP